MADDTLLDQVDEVINQAVAALVAQFPEQWHLSEYLVRKQLWDHLTEALRIGPDELREKADELEIEAEDEDFESADLNDENSGSDPAVEERREDRP